MPVDKNSQVDTNRTSVGNISVLRCRVATSLPRSLYRIRSFSLIQNIMGPIKDNHYFKTELNFSLDYNFIHGKQKEIIFCLFSSSSGVRLAKTTVKYRKQEALSSLYSCAPRNSFATNELNRMQTNACQRLACIILNYSPFSLPCTP